MNKQEAIQLLALIKVAYPEAYRDMDEASKKATVNMWAMSFHNFISMKNKFPECIINAQANCENRFMKMIVRVERNAVSG